MAALAGVALLCAQPLAAKTGTPGPPYFAGSYDIVGLNAQAGLINGAAQIIPMGREVIIRHCAGADTQMGFGPAYEVVNLMTGSQGGDRVECLFHNNGYNRPILTCRSEAGAAFTLWPKDVAEPLVCAP
jgi:hypothetical protein